MNRFLKRYGIFLFAGTLFCGPLGASSPQFVEIGPLKTLATSTVSSICQDGGGAVWLSTTYGLIRYNGTSAEYLGPTHTMRPLCGNGADLVYVAAGGAVLRYDIRTMTPRRFVFEGVDVTRASLCAEGDTLWIAFRNRILSSADGRVSLLAVLPGEETEITVLRRERSGRLVAGTRKDGLWRVGSDGRSERILDYGREITACYQDERGGLWVGTVSGGACRLDGERVRWFRRGDDPQNSLSNNYVRNFCEDSRGRVWIATMNGLNLVDTAGRCSRVPWVGDSRQRSVWSLCRDRQGGIWVGTFYGGVYYTHADDTLFTPLGTELPKGRHLRMINAAVEDRRGDLWLATDGYGLFRLRGTKVDYVEGSQEYKFKAVLYDPRQDVLWLGTHMDGLKKYDLRTRRWSHYHFVNRSGELYKEAVTDIREHGGVFYLATPRGVVAYDRKSPVILHESLGTYTGMVYSIVTDDRDNIWIGGQDLYCYNLRTRQTRNLPLRGIRQEAVGLIKLFRDDRGRIWGASLGSGFFLVENDRVRNFDQANVGLADNFVSCIGQVRDDLMAVGTNRGLSFFDVKEGRCYNYSSDNGLPIRSTRSGCILRRSGGEMVVGGIDGAVAFRPEQVCLTRDSVDFTFDKLRINNRPVLPGSPDGILERSLPYTPEITLKHDQTNIAVEIACYDFARAYPIFFEYRLEGHDPEWLPLHVETPITYMNLPAGRYTLRVRAALESDAGHAQEIALGIRVRAAWYATWLAKTVYVLLLLGIVFWLFYFYHVRALFRERLLQQSRESQSRTRFFTNLSHEIRTPLTLVTGQLEMFIRDAEQGTPGLGNILSAYNNSRKIQRMVTELLDFERQSQGYSGIRVREQDAVAFLREVHASFAEYARYREIDFRFDAPRVPVPLFFDRSQLQRVVYNLLMNAFKYTPQGGTVSLSVSEAGEKEVRIVVSDTGTGIPAESLPRIFDPFYQDPVSRSQDSRNPGTGIGLALSKGIVELHHGTLTAASVPGEGSVFTVSLPAGDRWFAGDPRVTLSDGEDGQPAKKIVIRNETVPVPVPAPGGRPFARSMLIVEDDRELREMMVSVFSDSFTVYQASDGLEGYDAARKLQPSIILSDIMMPVMEGLELCSKLKEDFETCHIPLILITAQGSEQMNLDGLRRGADDYIVKPFSIDLLRAKCNNILINRNILRNKFSRSLVPCDPVTTNSRDSEFLHTVMEEIEKRLYSEEITVPVLCRALGMGKTMLTHKIRGITGQSPGELIESTRLRKAAALIRQEPGKNISEIAYELGFSSPKYFGIRFKKQFGMTPTELRRNEEKTAAADAG